MGSYICAEPGKHYPEGHDEEACVFCLRAQRDGIRKAYDENIDKDFVARLREMDFRIHQQRCELARLNAVVAGKPSPAKIDAAFKAWVMPSLSRSDRSFSYVSFREGWMAARRAGQSPNWLKRFWSWFTE